MKSYKDIPQTIILTDQKDVPLDGEVIELDDRTRKVVWALMKEWKLDFHETFTRMMTEALDNMEKAEESA